MKVKDLLEKLKGVDPEMEVVAYQDGMEQHGIMPVKGVRGVVKVNLVKKETYDAFDWTTYDYDAYEENKEGSLEVFRLS